MESPDIKKLTNIYTTLQHFHSSHNTYTFENLQHSKNKNIHQAKRNDNEICL